MQSQGPISIVTRESALRQGDIREGLTLVNALPITLSVFINLEMAVGLDDRGEFIRLFRALCANEFAPTINRIILLIL
jgi:hypothetical protein